MNHHRSTIARSPATDHSPRSPAPIAPPIHFTFPNTHLDRHRPSASPVPEHSPRSPPPIHLPFRPPLPAVARPRRPPPVPGRHAQPTTHNPSRLPFLNHHRSEPILNHHRATITCTTNTALPHLLLLKNHLHSRTTYLRFRCDRLPARPTTRDRRRSALDRGPHASPRTSRPSGNLLQVRPMEAAPRPARRFRGQATRRSPGSSSGQCPASTGLSSESDPAPP